MNDFAFGAFSCSEREFQRGDEITWYADGDKIVRNEYNPATAYAFGIVLIVINCTSKFEILNVNLIRFW